MTSESKVWYVELANTGRRGPLSENDVRELIAIGKLSANSLCLREGASEWHPIGSIPTFEDAFRTQRSESPYQTSPPPEPETKRSPFEEGMRAIRKTLRLTGRETARQAHLAKLHMRLLKLQHERKAICTVLGSKAYEQREELAAFEQLQPHINAVTQCDQDIENVQREITDLNAHAPQREDE